MLWPKYTPDVHIGDHLFEPGQILQTNMQHLIPTTVLL